MSDKKVSIPESLYERIESRSEGTGFESVSEYVTFVLREVIEDEEEEEEEEEEFSEEDEEKVKERLKALGYMD